MGATKGLDGGGPLRALAALAREWDVPCDDRQAEMLLHYAGLLLTWNERINLTGAHAVDELLADHFPDSFALAARLDRSARAIDVGSGGGLPAIPLAILRPELTLVLCEPLAKKGAFLRTAIRELALGAHVRLEARRAEDLAAEVPTSFDLAFSRATLAPDRWVALGRRLVRPQGRIFVLTTPETSLDGLGDAAVHTRIYADGRRALLEVVLR
jgi:16S rRNA (guanine527-N7)-methyltransferase